jgi:hypothetical protein
MTRRDRRSVGEILLDADHTARDLLPDVGDLDAAAVLRTWPEVVHTATTLWSVLPRAVPVSAAGPNSLPDTMARVAAMTAALHRGSRSRRWPGPGPTDPRMQSIADCFARAAELIDQHRAPGPARSAAARDDADAARARIIHTLYVTSHGVRLAVLAHISAVEATVTPWGRVSAPGGLGAPRSVLGRLDAVERVTGAYVSRTFPAALAREHRHEPYGSRVATAVAAWDVHAHRAIVANPTPGHLRLVSRTQELLLGHTAVLLSAAAQAGAIDAFQYATRLEQPLDLARATWGASGRSWAQFAAHAARPDSPVLTQAAAELRASLREITIDGSTAAAPEVIASRVNLSSVAGTLATVLSSSTDLAHVVRDLVTDPAVTFPARAVNAAAVAGSTNSRGDGVKGSDAAHVGIKDLTMNRPIPLTPAVRALEVGRADYLVAANQTAAIAASWLPTFTAATEGRQKATATRRSRSPQPARARAGAPSPGR